MRGRGEIQRSVRDPLEFVCLDLVRRIHRIVAFRGGASADAGVMFPFQQRRVMDIPVTIH